MLVAFSALVPPLRRRLQVTTVLAAGGAVVLAALARGQPWLAFAAMGLVGLGVGAFSAATPTAILAATPPEETSSAMSFNQVVRSVGFSIGSALGGLVLSAHTGSGATYPTETGYTTAAWIGAAAMAVTIVISLALPRTAELRLP